MKQSRRQNVVHALPSEEPEIGRWLWMLDNARERTRETLEGTSEAIIDWQPAPAAHSIGTLLYHIAAIEMDWYAAEVMEGKLPAVVWDAFPDDVRDAQGRLTVVQGVAYAAHWERLDSVRRMLLDTYQTMSLDEFRRVRHLEHYDVTPEWVLHHLCQHEAEHRSEIAALRAAAEKVRDHNGD